MSMALEVCMNKVHRLTDELLSTARGHLSYSEYGKDKLREALHDLLGAYDGRDPGTDGPIDLETNGTVIRKAQVVLAEVE